MDNQPRKVTPNELNGVMEFDHVIRVHPDGTVSDADDMYSPELHDGEISSGWVLMNGYSAQCGYSGPIMHSSECIGGVLADDILSTPGVYVALYDYSVDEDGSESDGWAVARRDTVDDDLPGDLTWYGLLKAGVDTDRVTRMPDLGWCLYHNRGRIAFAEDSINGFRFTGYDRDGAEVIPPTWSCSADKLGSRLAAIAAEGNTIKINITYAVDDGTEQPAHTPRTIEITDAPDLTPEQWAEAVYVVTNAPADVHSGYEGAQAVRTALASQRGLPILCTGDTVTVDGVTLTCASAGWERV